MPTLKAYACRLRGFQDETIEYADTAGNRFWAHRPDEARLTLAGDHERNCHRVY